MLPPSPAAWQAAIDARGTTAADAYRIAIAAHRAMPALGDGYRIFWVRRGMMASREVTTRADGYLVIGRHSMCDVVLDDERAVSLRHVILRASPLDDGGALLRVLDLQSSEGFELSDGTRPHGIAATGPVVFRIGVHAVVCLPSGSGVSLPDDLPVPLVQREAGEAPQGAAALHVAPLPSPSPRPVSRITLVPRTIELATRTSELPNAPSFPSHDARGEPFVYELSLESQPGGARRAVVRLTARDLDYGVLVGRSDKCLDAGLRAVLSACISRVHLLLLRERGQSFAYDVASTNGSFGASIAGVAAARFRCQPLDDDGTTLRLLEQGGVALHLRRVLPGA